MKVSLEILDHSQSLSLEVIIVGTRLTERVRVGGGLSEVFVNLSQRRAR